MTCEKCIQKFGLDKKVLWFCPEGKKVEDCPKAREFSWKNRPFQKKIDGSRGDEWVSVDDLLEFYKGHGLLVDEVKQLAKEAEENALPSAKLYLSFGHRAVLERLIEAVQNL